MFLIESQVWNMMKQTICAYIFLRKCGFLMECCIVSNIELLLLQGPEIKYEEILDPAFANIKLLLFQGWSEDIFSFCNLVSRPRQYSKQSKHSWDTFITKQLFLQTLTSSAISFLSTRYTEKLRTLKCRISSYLSLYTSTATWATNSFFGSQLRIC